MTKSPVQGTKVGIVANPVSGRDIRRLVARASVFPIAEKCNMMTRLLAGLGATGVERVLIMPDLGGVAERLRRAIASQGSVDAWPEVDFLDMPVEDSPTDTLRAVERMVAAKVGAIVVLGGDGTHRLVASACGEIPLTALSTGTNNVFPEMREATIAGMATGLVATGRVSKADATIPNKVLRVEINGCACDVAVVDASISSHWYTGSKALWHLDTVSQIFVTVAQADAIGLSSVAGLLYPVSRRAAHGLRVDLAPAETAALTVQAAIAPGRVVPVGVAGVYEISPGEPQSLQVPRGVIALDGEREIEFQSDQQVIVRLDLKGPLTIDIERVMAKATQDALFVTRQHSDRKKESAYATQQG
jgi:predicted polyphosphate/ATP-dependent NAD kinase